MISKLFNWQVPISWQRSFLVIFIAAITAHYFWYTKPVADTGIIELSSPTLSTSFEGLDYGEIELAFADLRFENEQLVLDANTESQFSIVVEQLPDGFESNHIDRLEFLVQQQFDGDKSQQILPLLTKMADYKKQESVWWEKNAMAQTTGENGDQFTPLFDLQDQIFGKELAQKLYHEQRRLMRYMTATYAIEKDDNLTEQQKQEALEALANTLEQQRSEE